MPAFSHGYPLVYEINTRCWLRDLSVSDGRTVTLADVPETEFARWRRLGFTHIWLMGVWKTGPAARRLALRDHRIMEFHAQHFPHDRPEDTIGGSPYAISEYRVPGSLGGLDGLARFRRRLHQHDLRLILDFVPNHLALDHPWIHERPELFLANDEAAPGFFPVDDRASGAKRWLAHGRDPNFPPWHDTAQLDYRLPATHDAMAETLMRIADHCDGVRCDMAMLVLPDIFRQTWSMAPPALADTTREFWTGTIPRVRARHPEFLMMAEAYWDLESRLQKLGFDFTYDKAVYDAMQLDHPGPLRDRIERRRRDGLAADVHFLENHDEPRAGRIFPWERHRTAALICLTLPGMRLLHEGQLRGARLHTPVPMQRRPVEPEESGTVQFYEELLAKLQSVKPVPHSHEFLSVQPHQPEDSNTMLIYGWRTEADGIAVICANHSAQPIRGRADWPQDWRAPSAPEFQILCQTHAQANSRIELNGRSLQFSALPWESRLLCVGGAESRLGH